MQTDPDKSCALCGEKLNPGGGVVTLLFGHRVSKKCSWAFNQRRQTAYIIDHAMFVALAMYSITELAPQVGSQTAGGSSGLPFLFACIALFLAKDCVRGISPGKLLCGLQVVDARTGAPIGLIQSLQRNVIIFLPFPFWLFVLAHQMRFGPRWGEEWANTRVIQRKLRHLPLFDPKDPPHQDWSSAAA